MEHSPDGETVPRERGRQRRKMRRLGTRHASLGRDDAECRDGANGWFSLGCSAGSCRRTSGAGVNYWGGSIRRKNNLAPQGEPGYELVLEKQVSSQRHAAPTVLRPRENGLAVVTSVVKDQRNT